MKIIEMKINSDEFTNYINDHFMGVITIGNGMVRLDDNKLEKPYRLVESTFIKAKSYDRLEENVLLQRDYRDNDYLIELGEMLDDEF